MKTLYILFIIVFLFHCSSSVRFDEQLDDRFSGDLASELENSSTFSCESGEDCTITETFSMDESKNSYRYFICVRCFFINEK